MAFFQKVLAALGNVAHVSSQNIREATRLSYTQVQHTESSRC